MREFFSNLEKKQKMMFIGGAAAAAVLIIVIIICISLSGSSRNYRNYYDSAEAAFLQGDYEESIELLEKAMDIDRTEECYLLMAEAYYASGDIEMAIQVLSLGNSRVGGNAISKRLEELSGIQPDDENSDNEETVKIAGKDIKLSVKSLLLSGKGLTDSEVSAISQLKQLESLSLSGNSITGLSFLSDMTTINFLQLSDNKIVDLSPIASLSKLKTLYIDNNPIEDLTPLYGLKALRTLSMKGIGITDAQLEELQEALPDCKIYTDDVTEEVKEITMGNITFKSDVTELDLRGQNISDLSPLAQCTQLVKLDLRNNSISDLSPLSICRSWSGSASGTTRSRTSAPL